VFLSCTPFDLRRSRVGAEVRTDDEVGAPVPRRGDPSEAGMTTTIDPRASLSGTDAEELTTSWLEELFDHLPASCFPGTHDDLAAALLRQHAPSHLLWHLSVLPRGRRFDSAEDLATHLEQLQPAPAAVAVPW
jgi:hypothetical protein